MLTVILDLTIRCPRDRFFLTDERLLTEVALESLDWARERDAKGETLLLHHGFAVSQAITDRVSGLLNGALTRSLDPACDAAVLLAFVAKQLPNAQGALLYLNPFQGALTKVRLEAMPLSPDPGEVFVSSDKVASNIHPLWVSPVSASKRDKSTFVLRKEDASRTLRDDPIFMKRVHKDSKQPILGSQFLQTVYMLDAALVSVDFRSIHDNVPEVWTVKPVIGGDLSCSDMTAMPWFYCVPIFNMSRETRIDWTPKMVPVRRDRDQTRTIEE